MELHVVQTEGGNHANTQSEHLFCQTERMLELLVVFESGPTSRLDLKQHYLLLLQRYSRELELLRKTYQRQRDSPPIGRNLPPVIHLSLSQCLTDSVVTDYFHH